ncbi:MAG: hypothetical protein K2P65_08950, partial [Lachnospiraceae bacterium]|nr:hypothetical protein [Lachnospiraceae bacterium]
ILAAFVSYLTVIARSKADCVSTITFSASSGLFFPGLRLTKAHQPSPTITAMARTIMVSRNTTVFAAFP